MVAPVGFDPSIFRHDETDSWSVYCTKEMLATYEAGVVVQSELNRFLQPHGGQCELWYSLLLRRPNRWSDYLIRALDGPSSDPSVSVRGPYGAGDLDAETKRLGLPSLTRKLSD